MKKLLAAIAFCTAAAVQAEPSLIVIIDDVGNNRSLGKRAVELPGPVTLAFLPHTPFAAKLAEKASDLGQGIMLHAPMANETGAKLGPGAMTEDMDQQTLQQTLKSSLDAIPHVQGVNNHMGSRLTQKEDSMRWVMDVVSARGLYFIDSLTNPASVAAKEADHAGIAVARRDVFLDNDRNDEALQGQFDRALEIAQRRGHAILIGHPYPETLDFLEQQLPGLKERTGVRLMRADRFLMQKQWQAGEGPEELSRLQLDISGS